jgi:uncharacterized phage-like protein YoqJ
MGRTCCGFGHRIVLIDVEGPLREVLCNLIETHGVTRFLSGGMGEFDELFSKTVHSLRGQYPQIRLCLVVPYLTKRLNDQRELLPSLYDEIILPAELDGANKKAAIPLRNRWMVDNSDFVISAVHRDFGGAYEAVAYAVRQGVPIIKIVDKFS